MKTILSLALTAWLCLSQSSAHAQLMLERMQFEKMGDAYELADDGTFIFAATDSGIFRLSGDLWQRLRPAALRDIVIYRLASQGDGNLVGFGTDVIVRTTNGGSQWTVKPETISGATELIDIVFSKAGTLLLGTNKGLRRSTDLGDTWKASNTGLSGEAKVTWIASKPDGELFCSQSNYVYRSQDDGNTWSRMNSGVADGYYGMAAIGKDTIYLGGPKGIYRSINNGETWKVFNLAGYYDTPATSVLVDAQGRLFATTYYDSPRGGAYVSLNAGKTWEKLGAQSSQGYHMLLDDQSRLLVATSAGVYRSTGTTLAVSPTTTSESPRLISTTEGLTIIDQNGEVASFKLFDINGREVLSSHDIKSAALPPLKGVLLYSLFDRQGKVIASGTVIGL